MTIHTLPVLALLATQAAGGPSIDAILSRAGDMVRRFEREFALVISDERYEQKEVTTDTAARVVRAHTQRVIKSETLFAWVPEQRAWLTARNVLAVDGKAVADSRQRLDSILADGGPESRERLRRLRDESARFNVGRIYRNFADPTLVLQFLDPGYQSRFSFSFVGVEKAAGVSAWRVAFSERARPAVIQTPTSDVMSAGTVWISQADGSVVRTVLTLRDEETNTTASIEVEYSPDARLGIRVPARMSEVYAQQALTNVARRGEPSRLVSLFERIECVATYSNYRRFETSGRLVSPP
jgi:hypothetical protein